MWLKVFMPNGKRINLSKPIGVLIVVIYLNFSLIQTWLYDDLRSFLQIISFLLIHSSQFPYLATKNECEHV